MLGKQKLKYIQSLGQKKFREQEQLFIAEGPKIVNELLDSSIKNIFQIYAVKDWIEENIDLTNTVEVIEVADFELEKISQLIIANNVLALVKQFDQPIDVNTKNQITLVLDTIQDPGNLGTIIRTADWFGIDQVICSNDCVEMYNPKVIQSTMGSIARVKMLYTDIELWLEKQKDVRIYATTLEGQDIASVKKLHEGIIIIGNESKGISPKILELANVKLSIPKKGKAESLNVAIAVGVILSHVC